MQLIACKTSLQEMARCVRGRSQASSDMPTVVILLSVKGCYITTAVVMTAILSQYESINVVFGQGSARIPAGEAYNTHLDPG